MNCPTCNKEMERGYIYPGHIELEWYPENESIDWKKESIVGSLLPFDIFRKERLMEKKHGVKLMSPDLHSGDLYNSRFPAYLCRDCSVCFMDYKKIEL